MKAETFFNNFELFASAPNGVLKLRELILQLAVQGKLVPKYENDEPVKILQENMKAERERLIKQKKIKMTESLPLIKREEVPFHIPKHWEWVRIGDAMNLINGVAFKPTEWSASGLPIIRIQNLNNHDAPFNFCNFDVEEKFHVRDSDFLISWSGTPGTSFGAFIWNRGHAILNQHIFRAELFGEAYQKDFLKHAINAFLDEMIAKAHGAVGLQHITKGKLESLCIPLPPLAEQRRIVAKVDQLMSLCDELEAHQKKMREYRALTNGAALEKLMTARAPHEVAESWRRIYDNFDLLYDAPENVGALRQAILQHAVMGKLVEQDDKDEPASVLLEKIKAEKERLIKENKINKGKQLPIKVEDIPYAAPNGWEWIRLQEIGEFCGGSTPSTNKSEYWGGEMAWVSPKDMKEKRIQVSELTITDKALQETRLRIIPKNSILIVARSGILKRLLPIAVNDIECTVNQDLKVIIPFIPQISDYLQLMFKGHEKFILTKLVKGGMTVQSLKYTEFEQQPFPLPPLTEQRRIVTRVDQLMSLCDKLEAGLMRSQAESEKLMEAVVGRMLAE